MSGRLEGIIKSVEDMDNTLLKADMEWLIKQVEELENRNKVLEYASKYNGELNVFLQKRKLPPNTLGRHVVDVVMNYVEELENEYQVRRVEYLEEHIERLEQQNKRYRETINKFFELDGNYKDIVNKAERIFAKALDEALERKE